MAEQPLIEVDSAMSQLPPIEADTTSAELPPAEDDSAMSDLPLIEFESETANDIVTANDLSRTDAFHALLATAKAAGFHD